MRNKENHQRWYQEYKQKNQERLRKKNRDYNFKTKTKQREHYLQRTYGISKEQYDQMFIAQDGRCAICGNPESVVDSRTNITKRLAVDHDHTTGKIRQLLCFKCNTIIGTLDVSMASKMAQYLTKWSHLE